MDFLAVWRDISLLWLIFLTLIPALIASVILFFCVKGMHRLRQVTEKGLSVAKDKAQQVANGTERASQKVVRPFIAAHAAGARIGTMARTTVTRRKQP